jgi:hypothetical protein
MKKYIISLFFILNFIFSYSQIKSPSYLSSSKIPNSNNDTIQYFLFTKFEDWTTSDVNNYAGLMAKWPITGYYIPEQQSIIYWDNQHGNVWDSFMPYNAGKGIEMWVPLCDTASDIWMSYDLRCDDNYSDGRIDGLSGQHKYPGGFVAGDDMTEGTIDEQDSTSLYGGRGGWAGFVTGSNNNVMLYPFYQPEDGNWYGHPNGGEGQFQLPIGRWIRITIHARTNVTPGQFDGFWEIYVDGVLMMIKPIWKSRSVAQGINYGKFEMMRWSYFFSEGNRASTRNNHIYIDNVVVWKYKQGASLYGKKMGNFGDIITKVTPPEESSYRPPELYYDESYTADNDTIYDLGKDKGYLYWPYYSNKEITKEVTISSGTIGYSFIDNNFGYDWPGECTYVKVYKGTGINKELQAIYGSTYCEYTNPSGNYTIDGNEATFVIFPGSTYGYSKGISIKYWQTTK